MAQAYLAWPWPEVAATEAQAASPLALRAVFRNACGTATCVVRFRQGFLIQLLPDR
jgi:hypothetical protein